MLHRRVPEERLMPQAHIPLPTGLPGPGELWSWVPSLGFTAHPRECRLHREAKQTWTRKQYCTLQTRQMPPTGLHLSQLHNGRGQVHTSQVRMREKFLFSGSLEVLAQVHLKYPHKANSLQCSPLQITKPPEAGPRHQSQGHVRAQVSKASRALVTGKMSPGP